MAKADLNRFMDDARVHCPGAVDAAIQQELFRAVDELLRRSSIWQEDITVAILASTTSYDLVPIDDGLIHRLMWVLDANKNLVGAEMREPGTLTLQTTPTAADTYVATVAKTVIDPVTRDGYPEYPEWLFRRYADGLLDGTLSRLFAQAAKSYTNPTLAVLHFRRFQAAIAQANRDARHSNLYGAQRWKFPKFAV